MVPHPVDAPPTGLHESALAFEVEFLAVKAAANGSRRANQILKPLALKVRSYAVLALACEHPAPSQRTLAEFLSLDPSQIVALVDELEARRLVRRVVDENDRRSKAVRATDAGRLLNDEARELTRAAEDASLADLTTEQREQLRGLLRTVVFGSPPPGMQ